MKQLEEQFKEKLEEINSAKETGQLIKAELLSTWLRGFAQVCQSGIIENTTDDKEIIRNWIKKQHGFFITDSKLECLICHKPTTKEVITKKNGLCMECFIGQIVQECKLNKIRQHEAVVRLAEKEGLILMIVVGEKE